MRTPGLSNQVEFVTVLIVLTVCTRHRTIPFGLRNFDIVLASGGARPETDRHPDPSCKRQDDDLRGQLPRPQGQRDHTESAKPAVTSRRPHTQTVRQPRDTTLDRHLARRFPESRDGGDTRRHPRHAEQEGRADTASLDRDSAGRHHEIRGGRDTRRHPGSPRFAASDKEMDRDAS